MDATEFPTCPHCLQIQICEWEMDLDSAIDTCENCGAVYSVRKQADGRYDNRLIEAGVK